MKLANKFGSITKLKDKKRRRPWVVREGKSGKQHVIGYAATKSEAMELLSKYNFDPWDVKNVKMTFTKLYELYLEKRGDSLGKSVKANLRTAYNHCATLYNMLYAEIKSYHMRDVIDNAPLKDSSKTVVKKLFWHLDRFALELEIINRANSDLVVVHSDAPKEKRIFTDDEIKFLWQHRSEFHDAVLVLIYTGFRIREAIALTIESYDPVEHTLTGGSKTEAGKNRVVPLHHKIVPIVEEMIERSKSGKIFPDHGHTWFVTKFHNDAFGHIPHEARHTFRSLLDSAGARKASIDIMMGHVSDDVGERIYTHKTIGELRNEIEKIKICDK